MQFGGLKFMIKLNEDKVMRRIDEIKNYKGFLPFQFDAYVSFTSRRDFLKSMGLWEKVNAKNFEVMENMRKVSNTGEYMDEVLLEWINKNPQFEDIIE